MGNDALYGFFYNDCIYESAPALISLHRTKEGAWKAMHKHQWDQWEDARSPKDTNLHLEKYLRRQTTCHRAVKKFTSSHIAKLEIKP